jgi:hypothetical protein
VKYIYEQDIEQNRINQTYEWNKKSSSGYFPCGILSEDEIHFVKSDERRILNFYKNEEARFKLDSFGCIRIPGNDVGFTVLLLRTSILRKDCIINYYESMFITPVLN